MATDMAIGLVPQFTTTGRDATKLSLDFTPQEQQDLNPYNDEDNEDEKAPESQSLRSEPAAIGASPQLYQNDYNASLSTTISRQPSTRAQTPDTTSPRSTVQHTTTEAELAAEMSSELDDTEPPQYDSIMSAYNASRFGKITPREEEGCEKLPAYLNQLQQSAVFHMKRELDGLGTKSQDRKWRKVLVALNGTILSIYNCTSPLFSIPSRPDLASSVKMGSLIKTYTLQHAEVGIASDYQKRKYTLRLRVETEQILLSCTELETLIKWIEKTNWAIDLSLALDERPEINERTLPRHMRRRRRRREAEGSRPSTAATGQDDEGGAAGEDELRRRPGRVADVEDNLGLSSAITQSTTVSPTQSRSNIDSTNVVEPEIASLQISHSRFLPTGNTTFSSLMPSYLSPSTGSAESRVPLAGLGNIPNYFSRPVGPTPSITSATGREGMYSVYPQSVQQSSVTLVTPPSSAPQPGSRRKRERNPVNLDLNENGKWRPQVNWCAMFDTMWAKKCLPKLEDGQKRKTSLVIFEGKRYFVHKDLTMSLIILNTEGLLPRGLPTYEQAVGA